LVDDISLIKDLAHSLNTGLNHKRFKI